MEELRHKIRVKSFRLTSHIPWLVGDNLCRFKIHDFRFSVRADNQRAGIKNNNVAYLRTSQMSVYHTPPPCANVDIVLSLTQ